MKTIPRLTPSQFDALVGITSMRPKSNASEALRAVMVDGQSVAAAAEFFGITRALVYRGLDNAREHIKHARVLAGAG